jgi:hypothetical protein
VHLVLERQPSGISCTIGKLYIDGQFECFTLEDLIRETDGKPVAEWKIYGKSAIPAGTYEVKITMSNRFKRELPLLVNVEGFTGVRVHPGNTDADTEGCILPGTRVAPHGEAIEQSRAAFDRLFEKLEGAQEAGEEITIEVRNP